MPSRSSVLCGLTCHTVMAPEYTAYLVSPHSRVACTECHIGPGASWFVRSKLLGMHQLFAVAFHTYPRPIPVPVRHLRPARETCERCHWPQMFHGDKLVVLTSHADDKANTPSTTVLSLKVGGRRWDGADGIHGRHLGTGVEISYVALDEQRQVIPLVTHRGPDGRTVEYRSAIRISPAAFAAMTAATRAPTVARSPRTARPVTASWPWTRRTRRSWPTWA